MATKRTATTTRPTKRTATTTRATTRGATSTTSPAPAWTFLTNHAHVLFCLAERPDDVRVRDVAARVGITERAVQRILSDLEAAGYIERTRVGRRSIYVLDERLPLRHPIEAHRRVVDLLALVFGSTARRAGAVARSTDKSG